MANKFLKSRMEIGSRNRDIKIMISELSKMKYESSSIAKSSIIMMIYNMIEGVFLKILEEVFDNKTIAKYPHNFLFVISNYYFEMIRNDLEELLKYNKKQKLKRTESDFIAYKTAINKHTKIKSIKRNFDKLQKFDSNVKYIPTFTEYIDKFKFFSGNLDENKIREISEKKFGVIFSGTSSDSLLTLVREKRNKLAHGETKYSMECNNMTDTEIRKIQKAVFNYMKRVMQAFEKVYI